MSPAFPAAAPSSLCYASSEAWGTGKCGVVRFRNSSTVALISAFVFHLHHCDKSCGTLGWHILEMWQSCSPYLPALASFMIRVRVWCASYTADWGRSLLAEGTMCCLFGPSKDLAQNVVQWVFKQQTMNAFFGLPSKLEKGIQEGSWYNLLFSQL